MIEWVEGETELRDRGEFAYVGCVQLGGVVKWNSSATPYRASTHRLPAFECAYFASIEAAKPVVERWIMDGLRAEAKKWAGLLEDALAA